MTLDQHKISESYKTFFSPVLVHLLVYPISIKSKCSHRNNLLAKALYDNKAECADELGFRKGDILTVIEQNVVGSEGWWKCSLYGRQGLAPANRLQVLAPYQIAAVASRTTSGLMGRRFTHQNVYQVPTLPKAVTASPEYEQMESVYKVTPNALPPQEVYQVPSSSPVKTYNMRAQQNSPNKNIFVVPKLSRASTVASLLGPQNEVYDIPSSRSGTLFSKACATPPLVRKGPTFSSSSEIIKNQQLYDIPVSSQKAKVNVRQENESKNVNDIHPVVSRNSVPREAAYDVPSSTIQGSQKKVTGLYNTLPNPRKSEWTYDVPVSPEKGRQNLSKQAYYDTLPAKGFSAASKQMLYDVPPNRYESRNLYDVPPSNVEANNLNMQLYNVPPVQRKLAFSDQHLYDVPPLRDMPLSRQNVNYDVPPTFQSQRMEQQKSKQSIYDIPKGCLTVVHEGAVNEQTSSISGKPDDDGPTEVSSNIPTNLSDIEYDTKSVCSLQSKNSIVSTSSTTSYEPSALPHSEPAKEITLDLDSAIDTLNQLQHKASNSIASLMVFVSSKWRQQEHLEKHLQEIRTAIDNINETLGKFLDFAQGARVNATCLIDTNLQARLNKQLQIVEDSYEILRETRQALSDCNWSLHVLVVNKPQINPDDLDRFVMVARTIPDDIKRFVSIIIANGKLLFKQNTNKQEIQQAQRLTTEKEVRNQIAKQVRNAEMQKSAPVCKTKDNKVKPNISKENVIEDCDYVQLQASKPSETHGIPTKKDVPSKVHYSEHCKLYFGALHKALSVFKNSLSNNQPPEVFISHSKLVIMVGQKLVDTLCREVQGKDIQNDVLYSSSQLCSLLKNLALSTKKAAVQYPNPTAVQELQDRVQELSQHAEQFRSLLEL
ncbi:cas scaffolding protein family member 4 [Latimeria chalumnae]|uniref:cas scaffolding protein family member 4 n=1 Tax=Latimeria chalumnae TaxID=7897 RepID=UPI00313D8875